MTWVAAAATRRRDMLVRRAAAAEHGCLRCAPRTANTARYYRVQTTMHCTSAVRFSNAMALMQAIKLSETL